MDIPQGSPAIAQTRAPSSAGGAPMLGSLARLMTARAPAEDVDSYPAETLTDAVALAARALEEHRRGKSFIAAEGLELNGVPLTVVTVVNDNMPFLFDSVLGEIAEAAAEPTLVMHPVLLLRRNERGGIAALADARAPAAAATETNAGSADRVSLIQVHVPALDAAACDALRTRLGHVLAQVRAAVADWKPMLARLDEAISGLRSGATPLEAGALAEAAAFLEWLRDNNFTFLGLREFSYAGQGEAATLTRAAEPGLGILRDPDLLVLRKDADGDATTPEVRAFLQGPDPLIVTKANTKSLVHRRIYLDYVGVKQFDAAGSLLGELRIVGLFTSSAYTHSVLKIPFLRAKAGAVLAGSGFDPSDHSGKALIGVLESYPRDELFQVPVPILEKHAQAILALGERPRVRVLLRADQFDRFVSAIVFVPRDRYDSRVGEKIGDYLKTAFGGRLSAFYPAFPEGSLARVHFIIGRSGGETPDVGTAELEAGIRDIVRTWDDALRDAAARSGADASLARLAGRLPPAYRDTFSAVEALGDARRVAGLSTENPIAVDFLRREGQGPTEATLKIFHYGGAVALSRRVPILENTGFRVISEQTFELEPGESGASTVIHDMEIENAYGAPVNLTDSGALLEETFLSVWRGLSDNDGFNALAQTAGLNTRAVGTLRAYGRYLQQAGLPQSQDFVAAALNRYPLIARDLFALFSARFDPAAEEGRGEAERVLAKAVGAGLDAVANLDDDTILRRILLLIEASLRTNFFAPDAGTRPLVVKLDSRSLPFLPEPRPWREIFVYGPEVEGVHLRFGPVARGGLRWSDRAQDYRTEVLGLVKAQQVKNAVIVPVGAKGGFFPKRLPTGGRDAVFEAGKQAYVTFVSSLLSITDNLDAGRLVPPEGVVRHDGDDPYFVVAADKGTATFSDTANSIARAHGFWLDDAFASGGSAGYDHKKMGITARGAWEAVKRHFREMNRDIQAEPFTVAGVGDMSGDVFGNGLLLSPEIRLVAAFDHRDIFLDPDPDPAVSLAERQRLFALPRSSWQDYDRTKLSPGGGVISRAEKSILLSPQAARAIGMAGGVATTPAAVLKAIVKAPVDLLWFGGIGTYVKATPESQADAGDRANDAIRVSAAELRARVIGEGANLGVTQRGRIEFGLQGGRCNSDAIDNSGGVNSSDVEVNIKIALSAALASGRLTREARNDLLATMTDEVAALVLANNHRQTLAISLAEREGIAGLPDQARLISALEERGLLDRTVETLPSPTALAERQSTGKPLTRAEIGVLLAYAKIVLFSDLIASPAPDDAYFDRDLLSYFPSSIQDGYPAEIGEHRLRREIIARVLVNDLVDRGGPTFAYRVGEASGAGVAEVVTAYAIVRDGFDLPDLFRAVDGLDNRIDGQVQLGLYAGLGQVIEAGVMWFLKNARGPLAPAERVAELRQAREALAPRLMELLPRFLRERLSERQSSLVASGVEEPLAEKLVLAGVADLIPDILILAQRGRTDLATAGRAFFAVSETFGIGRIMDAARSLNPTDYYDALALRHAVEALGNARRDLAEHALTRSAAAEDPAAAWIEKDEGGLARARGRLQGLIESGDITVSKLSVAAGILEDLAGRPSAA